MSTVSARKEVRRTPAERPRPGRPASRAFSPVLPPSTGSASADVYQPPRRETARLAAETASSATVQGTALGWDARDVDEMMRRLTVIARSLGHDFDLQIRAGDKWAYDFTSKVVTVPIDDMMSHSAPYNFAAIVHELAHVMFSVAPTGEAADDPAFHYLYNFLEDIRVNKLVSERYAGIPEMMKTLYAELVNPEARPLKDLTRTQQLVYAFTYDWMTNGEKGAAFITYPEVRDAFERTVAQAQEATRLPPGVDLRFDEMTDEERDAEARHSYDVILDGIWPVYQELVKLDLEDPQTQQRLSRQQSGEGQPQPDDKNQASSGRGKQKSQQATKGEGSQTSQGRRNDQTQTEQDGKGKSARPAEGKPSTEKKSEKTDSAATPSESERDQDSKGQQADGEKKRGTSERKDQPTGEKQVSGEKHSDSREESVREALKKLFEQGAQQLDPKLADPADPTPTPTAEETDRRKGQIDQTGDTDFSFEDQIKALEARAAERVSPDATLAYARIEQKYRSAIDDMVSEIANVLQRDDLPALTGYFRSGTFDLRKAIQSEFQRQANGTADANIFLRREEPQERGKTEFILAIDISGSMDGPGIAAAREAFVVFQEALSQLGIRFGVIAYNKVPFIVSPLDKPEAEDKEKALEVLKAGNSNNEPGALRLARDMFEGSEAANKVLLVLTDGGAVKDAQEAVESLEQESNIKVIGIGVGEGVGEVPHVYRKHHLTVPNVNTLALRIGRVLESVLEGTEL